MDIQRQQKESPGITYSCYHNTSRDGEHFVRQHTISIQIDGTLVLNDGTRDYPSEKGLMRLIRRNQLLKFIKKPPEHGPFKSMSIYISQQILKDLSVEYGLKADENEARRILEIDKTEELLTFVQSLILYETKGMLENKAMAEIKIKEGVMLLLQSDPGIKNILFDFSEPYKTDLEAFMQNNYHFNVKLDRFAYLTGRSLATFKRDFEKIFHTSPGKWLQTKRLHQAHYLILNENKIPSEIYLDLGFEDLSHFSHAFKKEYGIPPKSLVKKQ